MKTIIKNTINWDKVGMILSAACAVHCVLGPAVILSMPIMARYYLAHPWFHVGFAFFIIPVGLVAFVKGYQHHKSALVLALGLPGLFVVGIVPMLIHNGFLPINEPAAMIFGSALLILAHYLNRKSCGCAEHQH